MDQEHERGFCFVGSGLYAKGGTGVWPVPPSVSWGRLCFRGWLKFNDIGECRIFDLSGLELAALGVWAAGVVVAVVLLSTREFGLRSRLTILIAALAFPVLGSLLVIGYGTYLGFVGLRGRQGTR